MGCVEARWPQLSKKGLAAGEVSAVYSLNHVKR